MASPPLSAQGDGHTEVLARVPGAMPWGGHCPGLRVALRLTPCS